MCDQRVWKVWIDESASMIDWIDPILTGAGFACEFDANNQDPTGGIYYISYSEHFYTNPNVGMGEARGDILERYIASLGHSVAYDTCLVELEREEGKAAVRLCRGNLGSSCRRAAPLLSRSNDNAFPASAQSLMPSSCACYYNVRTVGLLPAVLPPNGPTLVRGCLLRSERLPMSAIFTRSCATSALLNLRLQSSFWGNASAGRFRVRRPARRRPPRRTRRPRWRRPPRSERPCKSGACIRALRMSRAALCTSCRAGARWHPRNL